ncbi:MAG: hypothetical protein LC122_05155 [Chitinophagales bacterium]|nr:hypothetical protein [Chitinophagales bacterium]
MKTSKLVFNLSVIAFFAVIYAAIFNVTPLLPFFVLLVAGISVYWTKRTTGANLFDGLAPEVWIPLVKEDFYPSNSFLNAATDMSSLVNNDKINFAEVGAEPDVLKNNTNYPVAAAVAQDVPLSIELDYYDTTSTIIRNAIAAELIYDQRLLYANRHKKVLFRKIGIDAAYAYAPVEKDAAKFNEVISLGSNDSVIDAIIDLQKHYNNCDEDGSGRNLVLCASHMAMIAKEDKVLYKSIMAESGAMYYGFRIWNYTRNPIYITATGTKAAQGAAFDAGTHKHSSFSFLTSEVMKAQGTVEMFSNLKDPDIKGDKFNFQMRALVGSLRGKYAGAILK